MTADLPRARKAERAFDLLELVGIVALTILTARAVITGVELSGPLGWDESIYAIRTRSWLGLGTHSEFGLNRGHLLSILGVIPYSIARSDFSLRMLGVFFSAATVAFVGLLGRRAGGRGAGLISAAAVLSASVFWRQSPLFMTDIPAAFSLLVSTLFALEAVKAVRSEQSARWPLIGSAVAAAAAFHFRHASLAPAASIALVSILACGRRSLRAWRSVLLAVVVLFVLLTPQMIESWIRTGTPWGAIAQTAQMNESLYGRGGIVQYVEWFPSYLTGDVAPWWIGAGFLTLPLVLVPRLRPLLGPAAFLAGVALVDTLAIGLTAHAKPRFLLTPIMLAMTSAAILLTVSVRSSGRYVGMLLVVICAVASALPSREIAADAFAHAETWARIEKVVRDTGERVAELAEGRPCYILTDYRSQISWYSGCPTYPTSQKKRFLDNREAALFIVHQMKRGPLKPEMTELAQRTEIVRDVMGRHGAFQILTVR